jgi:arsenite methyltransferase
MAIVCPVNLDTQMLRAEVSRVYSRVVADPDADFHFHRGPAYAAEFLGYDPAELVALPAVLDIGCGAGTDLLLAARRIGPTGRAIGIDMTDAMRNRALSSAAAAGLTNVEVYLSDATSLPIPDASVDVVISNGVLNLVPEKDRAFAEIRRVLRPGGRLQLGDIVIDRVRRRRPPQHRSLDRLNRRPSAGGRARGVPD